MASKKPSKKKTTDNTEAVPLHEFAPWILAEDRKCLLDYQKKLMSRIQADMNDVATLDRVICLIEKQIRTRPGFKK